MRKILNADVTSYYPSMIIKYDYVSRNISDPTLFEEIYNTRLKAKKEGDTNTANALKLVLNTTFGASNNKYNNLYDPLKAKSICITGQLFLIQLINNLSAVKDLILIQSNTDGILFSYPLEEEANVFKILDEWEKVTGFTLERDEVEKIIQKDVNNYIMKLANGKIKLKGAYVSDNKGSFKHNSLSIVATAIIEYLLNGVKVEDTIYNCNDILKFQMITKTGRTYDKVIHVKNGVEVEVQRVNRVYASNDNSYGTLYKVKRVGENKIRKDKVANAPEHCIVDNENKCTIEDIDLEWYVNLAKKRILDFEGGNKMEEVKEVKEVKTVKKTNKGKSLLEKIFDLQVYLSEYPFIKDGYNQAQNYEYVKSEQYRTALKLGCIANRLLFKVDITNAEHINIEKSDKMYLTRINAQITLVDIDSGEVYCTNAVADGSDMLDKGLYKAETLLIKNYVTTNFLTTDNSEDPEKEDILPKKESKFVSPEKQVEIKEKIIEGTSQAVGDDMINTLKELFDKIRSVEGQEDYGTNTYNKIINGEINDLFTANSIMIKLEEKINELGL